MLYNGLEGVRLDSSEVPIYAQLHSLHEYCRVCRRSFGSHIFGKERLEGVEVLCPTEDDEVYPLKEETK